MENLAVKFNEFNPETDNWDNYVTRLKFCFEANGINTDNKKRANFFTVCGAQVFETVKALITPKQTEDVTFSEIELILTKHYSPRPSEISMSYQFYKRDQKSGEKASDYIAQLRKLSAFCNFSDLERMLRDRLVCGMSDHKLQFQLLQREKLGYQEVVDVMLSSESAFKDVQMIQSANSGTTGELITASRPSSHAACPEPMDINAVQPRSNFRLCYRCGGRHGGECRFMNAVCHFCKKRGHIEKICIIKRKSGAKNTKYTNNFMEENEEDEAHLNGIYNVTGAGKVQPFEIEVLLEGMPVVMQVDTGACFSIVNESTWQTLRAARHHLALQPVALRLRTWTAAPVKIKGKANLSVTYRDVECKLSIIVANGEGPNLLGRDWLAPLNITMNIHLVTETEGRDLESVIKKYDNVFKEGLGTYRGQPVTIHLKKGATPKFLKARPVPYAIRDRVEREIERLVDEGVLTPTSFSEWATPVVPIMKKNGQIRLCGDYRSTVNQCTETDTFPMPTSNEVFATVAGSRFFTTLDLERAYTQVTVTKATSKLLTLNTCKGLYEVNRLAFGVKACPGIFQRLMTSLLAGIVGVSVLIDDIIIGGCNRAEMRERLDIVLQRIQQAGLRLNKAKCKFNKEKVEFLGFIIDAEGIHPSQSKIESLVRTPEPKNVRELQAFLGLYNFYERFIPHKATVLEPLHRLLDKGQEWCWTKQEQDSFNEAKRLITLDTTLVHYDLKKPLILTCDSSDYGIGVVLSHVMRDGHERPIAMGSRTLHTHERRYSQLDKEAAAIMFGITKFHNYITGRFFKVVTDHKPLLGIFDPKKALPSMLSPRLMRIAIALTAHDYEIIYKPGCEIGSADALSRWPQPVPEQTEQQIRDILLMAEAPEDFP